MDRRPPSTRVGRYAVYGAIASGGMASVHWGRLVGEAGFARVVAIKRLHPHFVSDPDFTTMLLDEARIVSRIRHPNVVPTLDVATAEGELLLVMEYVHGEALSRLLRALSLENKTVQPAIAVAIACAILDGLSAAHEATDEQGQPLLIVHRDVTPQNILVGVDGVARIADFGVARAAGRMHTTRDGVLKGKIRYMSPEQVRSKGVDQTTDIYAAGVVLWEMLVGRRAFDAESDVATMAMVLEDELPTPSSVSPGVSPVFDAIVKKAVARDPAARYATAREMALALEKAHPQASTREIGAWVTSLAAESLATHARALAAVESDDTGAIERARGAVASLATPSGSIIPPPEVVAASEEATRNLGNDSSPGVAELSQVTSLTASAAPRTSRDRRRWVTGIALLAIAMLMGTMLVVLVSGTSDNATTRAASGGPSASALPRASSSTAAAAPPTAPPSASASASPRDVDTHKPTTFAPPAGSGGVRPDCKDPFRLGSDGILHAKPECLR